jgi:uncharacterized damage-inducible protein DinB
MNNKLIQHTIRQLQEIQDGHNWLDENFRNKIDGLSDEEAFTRPIPELHSVAELIAHLVIWRRQSIRRLKARKTEASGNETDDWPSNATLQQTGWAELKASLYESQHELIWLLNEEDDEYLDNHYSAEHTFAYLIRGLIHHDLYHLGQIGITVKLLKSR